MGDGGLHALGQQDGDAVSLFDALGLQHVGTAVGEALEIAKAVARLAAVGVEMDERQTIRVGPPVAGVDSDVVVLGHLPAASRCQLLVARRLRSPGSSHFRFFVPPTMTQAARGRYSPVT